MSKKSETTLSWIFGIIVVGGLLYWMFNPNPKTGFSQFDVITGSKKRVPSSNCPVGYCKTVLNLCVPCIVNQTTTNQNLNPNIS